MKRAFLIFGFCLLLGLVTAPVQADTVVSGPGDIAFTGYNADGPGDIAFVLLADAPAGLQIHLTDQGWTDFAVSGTEGELIWTSPVGGLFTGTVIVITEAHNSTAISANLGSVSRSGNFIISNSIEAIYAFLGLIGSPSAFLSAIGNEDSADYRPNLTNTEMVDGDIIVFTNDEDIMAYIGPRDNLSTTDGYRAQINNKTNWITQDGTGDQHDNGSPPDTPFDDTPFTTPTTLRVTDISTPNIYSLPMIVGIVIGIFCITAIIAIKYRSVIMK